MMMFLRLQSEQSHCRPFARSVSTSNSTALQWQVPLCNGMSSPLRVETHSQGGAQFYMRRSLCATIRRQLREQLSVDRESPRGLRDTLCRTDVVHPEATLQ